MNTTKYLVYALMVILLIACGEEFLELKPNEALPTEDAIQSIDNLEAAVTGLYDGLQSSDHYGRYFVLVPDVMSDDVKQNASANRAKEYAEYGAFSDHFITQNMWARMYSTINRANTIINVDLEVGSTVQSQMDQLVGEAHAARALVHFDLVRMYGQHYGFTADNSHPGVPIVTEFDQNAEPSRNSVAQVYEQVIADLATAESLMGDDFSAGRFSKTAVKALRARVALYMSDWANAEKFASEVISSGDVSLTGTDKYVETWLGGDPPESIFEVRFNTVDRPGSDHLGRMYIQAGYGDYLPSEDVVNKIPVGDVRGELFAVDSNLGGIYGFIRVNKWPSETGDDNVPVIRLSEMYLIRAEARAMTGNETGAREDVTLIRQRGLPSAPAVEASGQELLDEIELEKRLELMFEGHRLFELMRKQKNIAREDCTAPDNVCNVAYPNEKFIMPMPQNEIDANPNIAQNPGY